jgi:hypothetical protein
LAGAAFAAGAFAAAALAAGALAPFAAAFPAGFSAATQNIFERFGSRETNVFAGGDFERLARFGVAPVARGAFLNTKRPQTRHATSPPLDRVRFSELSKARITLSTSPFAIWVSAATSLTTSARLNGALLLAAAIILPSGKSKGGAFAAIERAGMSKSDSARN